MGINLVISTARPAGAWIVSLSQEQLRGAEVLEVKSQPIHVECEGLHKLYL